MKGLRCNQNTSNNKKETCNIIKGSGLQKTYRNGMLPVMSCERLYRKSNEEERCEYNMGKSNVLSAEEYNSLLSSSIDNRVQIGLCGFSVESIPNVLVASNKPLNGKFKVRSMSKNKATVIKCYGVNKEEFLVDIEYAESAFGFLHLQSVKNDGYLHIVTNIKGISLVLSI